MCLEQLENRRVLATFAVPTDYTTIQAALDAAAANTGDDIVEIAPGVYDENPIINDNSGALIIRGLPNATAGVAINGGGRDDVVTATVHTSVTIENLSITNGGNSQDSLDNFAGRGINFSGSGDMVLNNVVVANNRTGGLVGANMSTAGTVQINGGDFSNNRNGIFLQRFNSVSIGDATSNNNSLGGLYVDNSGNVTVTNSQLNDNADNGIDLRIVADVVLSDLTVDDNGQSGISGLYVSAASSVTISDSSFTRSAGPGVVIYNTSGMTLLENVTADANNGRAIYLENTTSRGPVSVVGGSFSNNRLAGASFQDPGDITIDGASLNGNQPSGNNTGGGLRIQSSAAIAVTIENVTVSGNTAGANGGGIYVNVPSSATDAVVIRNSTITNNEAGWGQSASNGGGLFFANANGNATIEDSRVVGNRSLTQSGGGVRHVGGLTILGSTIGDNDAPISGGGIDSGGALTVRNSTIFDNHAGIGGGGIASYSSVTVVNSTISGNSAGNEGGGLHIESQSNLTIDHATIVSNVAPTGGGMSVIASTSAVSNTLIAGNTINSRVGEVSGFVMSLGYNVVGAPGPNAGFNNSTDQKGTISQPLDAKIDVLADNGGGTQTHALLPGSPALDAGNPSSNLVTDQRGESRPFDGNGDGTARNDVGAFESQELLQISPTVENDSFTTDEDQVLVAAAPGVLANDSDPNGASLTADLVRSPIRGTLTLQADGSFSYTPDVNFHGIDTFTYRAFNGTAYSQEATVSITIQSVNDAPIAVDDNISVQEGGSSAFAGTAQLDQQNTKLTYQFNAGSTADWQQRVTAGATGRLETVELYIGEFTDAGRVLDFFIAEGGPWQSGPYSFRSQYIMTSNDIDGWYSIDVSSANIQLAAGEQFTLGFIGSGNPDVFVLGSSVRNDGDLYPNGELWYNGSRLESSGFGYDLAFRTHVVAGTQFSVLANDLDPEGDAMTVQTTPVVAPQHAASLALNADGTFVYVHDGSENHSDSFVYRVLDANGDAATATVQISVTPVNDAPTAIDDSYSVSEDGMLIVGGSGVLANDTDSDSSSLSASLVTLPSRGSLTLNANGSFTYEPVDDYHGTDTFTYRASDGNLASNVATVTISIDPVNDAPTAKGETYFIDEDNPLVVSAPGVLINDSDIDGDSLTAVLSSNPQNGTVQLNVDGSFVYTPNANFHGVDIFKYRADDGLLLSNPVEVLISVRSVEDSPLATDDVYGTPEDTPLQITAPGVLANDFEPDGDPLTALLRTQPSHGSVAFASDGSFTYTPNPDFHGSDSFTYFARDGKGNVDTGTVSINVDPVNDNPAAVDDHVATNEDSAVVVEVLANDSDADGDSLTVVSLSAASNGAVSINADNTVTYSPNANFHGTDSFVYTITDGNGVNSSATVNVTVDSVNDDPQAVDAVFALDENSVNGTNVGIVSASDIDGDDLTFAISGVDSAPFAIDSQSGVLSVVDSVLLDFETKPQFDFVVEVSDGQGGVATAAVRIDLTDVLEVAIDVLPGDPDNEVRLDAREIEVAILGTANFDPLQQLDLGSLRLSATGSSSGAAVPFHHRHGYNYDQRDVNGDGVLDLVIRFKTSDTGLNSGDSSLTLQGRLKAEHGGAFFSVDQAITVVNGKSKGGGKGKKK